MIACIFIAILVLHIVSSDNEYSWSNQYDRLYQFVSSCSCELKNLEKLNGNQWNHDMVEDNIEVLVTCQNKTLEKLRALEKLNHDMLEENVEPLKVSFIFPLNAIQCNHDMLGEKS